MTGIFRRVVDAACLDRADDLVPLIDRQGEILHVQQRADAVLVHGLAQLLGIDVDRGVDAVGHHPDLQLRHLSDLLLHRHLAQEIVDAAGVGGRQRRERLVLGLEEGGAVLERRSGLLRRGRHEGHDGWDEQNQDRFQDVTRRSRSRAVESAARQSNSEARLCSVGEP